MPTATSKGSDFTPVPAGIHHAVCYAVIDLGTQPSQMFSPSRKVLLIWELPHERGEFLDEKTKQQTNKPRVISKEYTLSISKKSNLRRDLESWRGKAFSDEEALGFEVGVLVGHNCQLNVAHKLSRDGTKTYANVIGVVPVAKGTTRLKPENPTVVWDIPKSGPFEFPASMPEWIVTKIKGSEEYQYSVNSTRSQGPTDEELANVGSADAADEDVPF